MHRHLKDVNSDTIFLERCDNQDRGTLRQDLHEGKRSFLEWIRIQPRFSPSAPALGNVISDVVASRENGCFQ